MIESNTDEVKKKVPPAYFDIDGMFSLQKDFVNRYGINDTITGNNSITSNLSNNLKSLYNNFETANVSMGDILTRQEDMVHIVDTEKNRLDKKKETIDSSFYGKQRALQLNERWTFQK